MASKQLILTLTLSLCCCLVAHAQLSLSNGVHNLEITGAISTYYNYRVLKPGEFSAHKNRFKLRDAQMQLEGRYRDEFEYELQFDLADLGNAISGSIDPENPGLMDAYIIYKGIGFLDIRLGYGKTPYSRSSQVPFIYTPYWQRAELVRGDFFARRDVGLTLSSTFWRQRITVQAGMYNGIGEVSLRGDNDPSGRPEFMGRVDIAYPSRFRYRDIDDRNSPIPMFNLGLNARYSDKRQPEGGLLPSGSIGEYQQKVIDGIKNAYGIDFTAQYRGISVQFEAHRFLLRPRSANNPLFLGTDADFHEGYVQSGGFYGQINYFSKPLKSIFSARYETVNINDLAEGEMQRFSAAYAYQIKGFDAMIKAQYFLVLAEEVLIDPYRWTEQFRVGLQYTFK